MTTSASVRKIAVSLLVLLLQTNRLIGQDAPVVSSSGDQERLAILTFETRGLSREDGLRLRQMFAEGLTESKRFDVLPDDVLRNDLEQAGLSKIDSCNTPPCLAQLGKILNVVKIVHVRVDRWEERYILQIRLVSASDAALLYSERVDYTGEFNNLVSGVATQQGRKLSAAFLDKPTNWYLIVGGVLVGVGIIYYLFWTFATGGPEPLNNQPIGPMQ